LHRDLQKARHLFFCADELTEMAALEKKSFGMRFLKKVGANFARWYLRGNCQDGSERFVGVVKAVDEVKVSGATAPGTDSEIACQLRFGASRKGACFLVADVDPFDLFIAMNGVDDAVQGIAYDTVNPANARGD
jgi:hypothetical protein